MDAAANAGTGDSEIHERRKADHIRINLEEDVAFKQLTTGFESYFFLHEAVPDLNLDQINTTTTLLGKKLRLPLLISSMTGGTAEARAINRTLAAGAQQLGIAMGLGSQRAAIEDPQLADTYRVREEAPDILLLANLGAVQLNYGYGVDECRRAVEMVEADGLILHFNVLQEAVQPEGDGNFSGLLRKVEEVCQRLDVPVVAKEVGWGFSEHTVRQLADAGVAAVDVAGAGGTSWSQVEMHRAPTRRHARVAGAFIDWGIPTAVAVQLAKKATPHLPIFASGGIKNGIEIAKAIAMGATVGGLAGDFLRAANTAGVEGVVELGGAIGDELRVSMFCSGAGDLSELAETPLYSSFDELL